jgi:cytochrome c biogenesis protein CcdA
VLRLAIVGLTVGLADSLNPSTVGPAVYLATVANGTLRVIELVAGVALLLAATALWPGRRRLVRHQLPTQPGTGGSALAAGASIAVIELPTAIPSFAFALAIVGSSAGVPAKIALVGIYNVAFVAPLLAVALALVIIGEAADPWLERAGDWLQRRWPVVLATLLLLVGSGLAVLGGTGLVRA